MMYRVLAIAIVVIAMAVLPGCKKQESAVPADTPQQVQQQAEQADTAQQEQASPVTEENLNEQLDKMEQEIQEDIAAEE